MDLVFLCTGFQESESEEEGIEEIDDDNEDEHEHEPEVPVEKEPVIQKPPVASLPSKDTERQLSKKELKKKGLEELDAVLAELGLMESSGQDESQGNYSVEEYPIVIYCEQLCETIYINAGLDCCACEGAI